MEYYDIYINNTENLFPYSRNTTDIKCKGDSLETESVKLVTISCHTENVTTAS